MASGTRAAATLDDLYRVTGKAELIAGRIVHFLPTGHRPSRVAFRITRSLDDSASAVLSRRPTVPWSPWRCPR